MNYEWEARCSETTKIGTRINCRMFTVTVDASSEAQAREIIAEEFPEASIGSITKGAAVVEENET